MTETTLGRGESKGYIKENNPQTPPRWDLLRLHSTLKTIHCVYEKMVGLLSRGTKYMALGFWEPHSLW